MRPHTLGLDRTDAPVGIAQEHEGKVRGRPPLHDIAQMPPGARSRNDVSLIVSCCPPRRFSLRVEDYDIKLKPNTLYATDEETGVLGEDSDIARLKIKRPVTLPGIRRG